MNKYKNFLVITLIIIVPVILYYAFKSGSVDNPINIAQAFTSKKPVVLDFSSELCLECKELDKVLKPAIEKYNDKIVFEKIPINSNNPDYEKLIEEHGVNVVPTLVFIDKKGKTIQITEGSLTKEELERYLNKLIDG
ncbi:MAG: hypothetical protein A2287_01840 [Candidatus Melainabacteria bacterium RIFOXYA12_FULL_32_12]|nr:MAG: hypothetical protein A2255_01665 [Candidatus Melainabacteria bacterium RIFOXYA2_FULL_32_9]OGI27708.1 MAG: hypothetical protein A2287_01840 [Candidatus Melainabacteria bacterium RIFOXYA12_FULL_32_12]